MNTTAAQTLPRTPYRRHIFYIDSTVQRPLLVAMVLLEVLLVLAATALAYWQMNTVVEASLYRVHITHTGPVWRRLAEQGVWVLGLFAAINLLALVVAERLWSRRENAVIGHFSALVSKTAALDFTADSAPVESHAVLGLATTWRARERGRFAAVREQLVKLEAAVDAGQTQQAQAATQALKKLLA